MIQPIKLPRNSPIELRILSQIDFKDDCWIWNGCRDRDGYGLIWLNKCHRSMRVHRLTYLLFRGPLKYSALHVCDNPPCANPYHIYDGTQQQNIKDRDGQNHQARLGRPKIKLEDAQYIYDSLIEIKELASKFSLHPAHIRAIKRGKYWNLDK